MLDKTAKHPYQKVRPRSGALIQDKFVLSVSSRSNADRQLLRHIKYVPSHQKYCYINAQYAPILGHILYTLQGPEFQLGIDCLVLESSGPIRIRVKVDSLEICDMYSDLRQGILRLYHYYDRESKI